MLAACCFVKPSLAFVQGLAVLVAVVASGDRSDRAATARVLVPPMIAASAIAALLAATFGPMSLARTLSPATGAAIYRVNHFGFFHGIGRAFWDLPDATPRDYFRYEVGFWMLRLVPVRGTRSVRKRDMLLNDYAPHMEVDSQTYEVRADGELLVCEPARELPLAQRYFLF